MKTFKGTVDGKEFYFKVTGGEEKFYTIEPYQQKDIKPFKLVKRADGAVDGKEDRTWTIDVQKNVSPWVLERELCFNDLVEENLAVPQ